MIPVTLARTPASLDRIGVGCGYRYCHAPDVPWGEGSHTDCKLAQAKLQSNALALQTNMCRRMMRG